MFLAFVSRGYILVWLHFSTVFHAQLCSSNSMIFILFVFFCDIDHFPAWFCELPDLAQLHLI